MRLGAFTALGNVSYQELCVCVGEERGGGGVDKGQNPFLESVKLPWGWILPQLPDFRRFPVLLALLLPGGSLMITSGQDFHSQSHPHEEGGDC